MAQLRFPDDRAVGTLDWLGSYTEESGPVLAQGTVTVPDDLPIDLDVGALSGTRHNTDGGWQSFHDPRPLDLTFLSQLSPEAITSLRFWGPVTGSLEPIVHLAPRLDRLVLGLTDLADEALEAVSQLSGLTYLQSWGNRFTDRGVEELASLKLLEGLYLEEETLTVAAFEMTVKLPRLRRLGLQDVPLSESDLEQLRTQLPGVRVSQ